MEIPQQMPVTTPTQPAPVTPTPNFATIQNSQKKGSSALFLFLFILIFLILIGAGGFVFFINPKVQAYKASKQALAYIPDIRTQVSNVGDSLKKMYSIVTGQSQSQANPNTLLRLNVDKFISQLKGLQVDKGQVAGVQTQTQTFGDTYQSFLNNLKSNNKKIAKNSSQNKPQVMGESIPLESNRITLLRQLINAANQGSNSVKNADSKLKELNTYLTKDTSLKTSLGNIAKELETNNQNTANYLDQTGKTTSYYAKISDIQIKLEPLLASYDDLLNAAFTDGPTYYLERIKEIDSTMGSISNTINQINKADLPQGLEDLHNDNLKVIEILSQNIKDIQFAMKNNDGAAFTKTWVLLGEQLEPLSTRAVSLELSFWQNNQELNKHTSLIEAYKKQESALNKIQQQNKLPFFTN